MPKAQETVLEIDLGALQENFHYLKSKLQPSTKFLAVVKAFAYGSDAPLVANSLQELGVDYFAVAYAYEGSQLRDHKITKPILVLHPLNSHFEQVIDRCLEPSLYSLKTLKHFIRLAEEKNQYAYPIHLKLNTGLNRLGFNLEELQNVLDLIQNSRAVKVKSIFSHLAASEDLNEKEFSDHQIQKFKSSADHISNKLGYQPLYHILNTSGILNFPEAQFGMVRSGIGLYGFGNDSRFQNELRPIATLKTVISQIHTIEEGQSVGYNRAFVANRSLKTATLPIGHADGIGRQYGKGKGGVVINGKFAPIVGNVCMDMIMVDISHIECEEGDEAIVFGQQRNAADFAESANTISYEIITAISQRVKRKYLR